MVARAGVLGAMIVLAGCPGAEGGDTDAGTEDGGTSTGMTTTASTTATTTTASTTDSTTATTTASTTATSVTTTTTTETETDTDPDTGTETGGAACGAVVCAPDEYCDWPTNGCGSDRFDEPVCTPIPEGCPAVEGDPACGCDGVVYSDACAASLVGVDVDEGNACTPPGGFFECGHVFCDPAVAYCQVSTSDIGGFPNGYACLPLPGDCGDAPSCDCLADEPCAEFSCEPTADGGLLIICPGG